MRRVIGRGEALDLWFDAHRVYLFDVETGAALEDSATVPTPPAPALVDRPDVIAAPTA
jgi:hypothetical protein